MCATPNTTQRDEESVEEPARAQLWLRWVFPRDSTATALHHGLILGRDVECEERLEGSGVSRRHAEVQRQGPAFAIRDLGSTNGSFVNGKRVEHAVISPGSVLRLGEQVGVVVECVGAPGDFRELAAGLFGGHEVALALADAERAAASSLPIVIVGATGTGKERVAHAIHELSRRPGPFHALNCAALPVDLAEAELFGYRKGSFTGAERANIGHLRAADRGTLFLDEIADLPPALQGKLLRVLEEHTVTPLGETVAIPIDVRVLVAARCSLQDAVAAGRFREDLLARLAGLTLTLPLLRDRPGDVALLFQYFVNDYSGGRPPRIESKLIEALCLYAWPTNVRGLKQLAHQMVAVHGQEPVLKRSALPQELLARLPPPSESIPPASTAPPKPRREHDVHRLALALQQTRGNVASAAALLGFSRHRAYRLLDGRSLADFLAADSNGEHADDGEKPTS